MNRRVGSIVIWSLILLLNSCSDEEITPALEAEFAVSIPEEFQNTIYPSLVFGLAEFEKQGEEIEYFRITVHPNQLTDVKIVIQESKLNFETTLTVADVVDEKEIIPVIKWKYDDLKNLSQPGTTDITFVCYGNENKEIGRRNLKVSYRSINECVLAADIDSEAVPLYVMVASYVNEDSPIIDQFLKKILDVTILDSFVGYQQGEDMVDLQVAAAFHTMREIGIKYSSITATSNSNPNIVSQYIRFADEVLNNTQANCADGTVFFCSVLRKIGIHPIMVFKPGHVYLGYYLNNSKTSLRLLETTLVGSLSTSFSQATEVNIADFNSNLNKMNNSDYFDGYFIIDIEQARQIIKPIGR